MLLTVGYWLSAVGQFGWLRLLQPLWLLQLPRLMRLPLLLLLLLLLPPRAAAAWLLLPGCCCCLAAAAWVAAYHALTPNPQTPKPPTPQLPNPLTP